MDPNEGPSYGCPECGRSFSKPSSLELHYRVHTGEKPFQCMLCGRECSQRSNVKRHVDGHRVWPRGVDEMPDGDVLFGDGGSMRTARKCAFCEEAAFPTYGDFRRHLAKHEDEKMFHCDEEGCDAVYFKEARELVSHRKARHPGVKFFSCQAARGCDKKFSSLDELVIHHRGHAFRKDAEYKVSSKPHGCPTCPMSFTSAKYLHNHMMRGCGAEFKCPHCPKTFASDRTLRRHMRSHPDGSSAPAKTFVCGVCDKAFVTSKNLLDHVVIHTGDADFECEDCGMKFNRSDKLKRHRETLHSEQTVPCPMAEETGCPLTFKRKDKAKEHADEKHRRRDIKCKDCDEVFDRPSNLRFHCRKVHSKVKMLKCFKCKRKFKLESQRRQHHEKKHGLTYSLCRKEVAGVSNIPPGELLSTSEDETEEENDEEETVTDIVIYENSNV